MKDEATAWIVVAQWANSGDTYDGPWHSADDAERWAVAHLDGEAGCTGWTVGILSPAATS